MSNSFNDYSFNVRVALFNVSTGVRYKTLQNINNIGVTFALSDVGALQLKYNKGTSDSALLGAPYLEVAVEYTTDMGATWTEPLNGRFIRRTTAHDRTEIIGEIEQTFASFACLLEKICLSNAALNAQGNRPFPAATPGIILKTVLDEAHGHGVATALTYDFDTITDSAGVPWASQINIEYKPGMQLDQILRNLVDQGLVEWTMSGRTLQVYNVNGTLNRDKSIGTSPVIYKSGVEITNAPDKATEVKRVSRVTIYGDEGATLTVLNTDDIPPWGHFESSISQGGVKDTGTMQILSTAELYEGRFTLTQKTREINWLKANKFPFLDFRPGDYIGTITDEGQNMSSDRVRQITITTGSDGVKGNVVLSTRFEENQIKQAKKVAGIVRGATLGGNGTQPDPFVPGTDTRQPKAAVGLIGSSTAYNDPVGGMVRAQVSLSWSAVTQATNNSAMDIDHYVIWGRQRNDVSPVPFKIMATVDGSDTSVTMSPFNPNEVWNFYLRAYGRESVVAGVPTASIQVVMANDATAPPIPTAPILTSRGGTVAITWDGKGVDPPGPNVNMPLDFIQIFIQTAKDSAFTTGVKNLGVLTTAGTIAVADLDINATYFYRFRSQDYSKNLSDWSSTSSIVTQPLVDVSLIGRTITNANIVLETLTRELIEPGAIGTDQIAPGSIKTSRLAVGGNNKVVDPHFMDDALNAARIARAPVPANVNISKATSFNPDGFIDIANLAGNAQQEVRLTGFDTPAGISQYPIECIPGEEYLFKIKWSVVSGTSNGGAFRCAFIRGDGTQAVIDIVVITPGVTAQNTDLFGRWVVPANVIAFRPVLYVAFSSTSAVNRFSNPFVGLKYGSTLIEDGAITTNKIVANAVTAAKIAALTITSNEIAANAITADKITTGAITAVKIDAQAIDGKTITGAIFRSAASGARVEMRPTGFFQINSAGQTVSQWLPTSFMFRSAITGTRSEFDLNGMRLYNSAGALTTNLSSQTGNATITGVFRTDTDWPWIELNNALWSNSLFGIRFYGNTGHQGQPEIKAQADGPGQIANGGSLILTSGEVNNTNATTGHAELRLITNGGFFLGRVNNIGGAYINTTTPGISDIDISGGGGYINLRSNTKLMSFPQTTSPPNIAIGDFTILMNVISLNKYKLFQEPIGIHYELLNLKPKTWTDKGEYEKNPDESRRYSGFVAEEVMQASLDHDNIFHPLLTMGPNRELKSIQYERMIAFLIPIVKDMREQQLADQATIADLTARITTIEGA